MSKPLQDHKTASIFQLLSMRKVFYLIGNDRFAEIPPALRGYTSFATEELLDAIGAPVLKAKGEYFIFTSENAFFRGVGKLRTRDTLKDYNCKSISSPPALLLTKAMERGPDIIHLDYGSDHGVELTEEEFVHVEKLSMLANLAQYSMVFVLQDKKGYGMQVQLEDEKNYAIAFLSEDDSSKMIEQYRNESPGCRAEPNKLRKLISVLSSSPEVDGLLVDPGSEYELTLNKEELSMLSLGVEVVQGEGISFKGLVKGLFAKPQRLA